MTKRHGVNKTTRFEVFKRDSFKCQYCGRSAPDVTLQADHIQPASRGGTDDLLNLITCCTECNQGKNARLLSDQSIVQKRKRQLDEMQERREQMEMLLDWQRELIALEEQTIISLISIWNELAPGITLLPRGIQRMRRWLHDYRPDQIVKAMRTSTSQYLQYTDGKPTVLSATTALERVQGILHWQDEVEKNPALAEVFYIAGILRNRLKVEKSASHPLLRKALEMQVDTGAMKELSLACDSWPEFEASLQALMKAQEKTNENQTL